MDLTIIIPTRNRKGRVYECVHALEHNEADIIVVDDASEKPVAFKSNSARVIRHDRPSGRGASLNTGLNAALHDAVLIIDEDIYAAPDMVVRLMDEFCGRKDSKLALTPRVTWDLDVSITLTMRWMEGAHKLATPILLSKSFVLEHGGYDENFTRRLEDTELQLRLREHGLQVNSLETAVAFQNNSMKIRDLIQREFMDGVSSVFLHAKFPRYVPQAADMDALLKNETRTPDAAAAVEEIGLLEQAGPVELPSGVAELYEHVCRHYFLHGIFEGLRDMGATKPRRNSASTVAIYRQASYLEEIGEFDEARRLFRLVLHRPDEQYWDGAEYHLGRIEIALGDPEASHAHFVECLRLNPTHDKARRALSKPAHYEEVRPNVFEAIDAKSPAKALFVLFGDLSHALNAFPVVAALSKQFKGGLAWLTSPEHVGLARTSSATEVHEMKTRGLIPWDWIYEQGFTHVFYPEPAANLEEWELSGLPATDFMSAKCGVEARTRRPRIAASRAAISAASAFLRQHGLKRNAFITASNGTEGRHWPKSNLTRFAQQADLPVVVFGHEGDSPIVRTISCTGQPFDVITVLIGWSCLYLGPSSGLSWLAAATGAPMGLFVDPQDHVTRGGGLRETLRGEKDDIEEWNIYTNLRTVLDHLESVVRVTQ
jgi:TolA-binding protein